MFFVKHIDNEIIRNVRMFEKKFTFLPWIRNIMV